jgi:hypothetical protein
MNACTKERERGFRLKLLYSALTAPLGNKMGFLVMNTRLVLSNIFWHYTPHTHCMQFFSAAFFSVNSYNKRRIYTRL